ncbi:MULTISPECIES: hypothetical protein [Thermocrispum]|jgi:hypothetical protein|uniref:Transmembrane protein n=1 Tax=Thermocrispum agreste TaxID=37925 RepID=A0ABD6FBZ0_9PSEU|nr:MULTISPECIES: hypothetical protein [Thermocrispum]
MLTDENPAFESPASGDGPESGHRSRAQGGGDAQDPDVAQLASEIDEIGRSAAKRIDPGPRGLFVAVLVFVLMVAQLLPWVGDSAGWEVLVYGEDGAIPRLFAVTSTAAGIVASVLTLLTRRWWLSWVSAVGSCVAAVDGVLAIWSQQSAGASGEAGAGPGIGMVVAVVAMFMLAVAWLRTAWSRVD